MKQPILYYVDHTCRFAHNSGIQRCVRALARALLELGQPLLPVVWNKGAQRLQPAGAAALSHLAHWNGPALERWSHWPTQAEALRGSWLLIVELVSGPHNPSQRQLQAACEALQLRQAWLFHDAIPIRWPQLYGSAGPQAAACHATYMRGLGQAELVLCNSHTSRQHLLKFMAQEKGARAAELERRIVPLVLAEQFGGCRPAPPPERPAAEPLQILCVSTLEPRKNHRNLLKALAWLHSEGLRHWQLHLVGWAADQAIASCVERATSSGLPVEWHQHTDDAELEALYQRCDFTVYPSLEEGFGLPVAESLWQRRPCLCSGEGALGERAAQGGCLTVNTTLWSTIADGLSVLLTDSNRRRDLIHATEHRPFRTWRNVATNLISELEQASAQNA